MGRKRLALNLYYHPLGLIPAEMQPPLRLRLTELLLAAGNYVSAETEARQLLAADAKVKAKRLLALALYRQVQSGATSVRPKHQREVGSSVQQALDANPGNVNLSVVLAYIYRHEEQLLDPRTQQQPVAERNKTADGIMDAMVRANPKDPGAPPRAVRLPAPLSFTRARKGSSALH